MSRPFLSIFLILSSVRVALPFDRWVDDWDRPDQPPFVLTMQVDCQLID